MKIKVLKRQCTYNFMLMRDDSSVWSLRLKRRVLQFFIFLFFFFLLIGVSGLCVGYYYFDIIQDYAKNKQELEATRAQLHQLQNYESLAKVAAGPIPLEKNSPVVTVDNEISSNSTDKKLAIAEKVALEESKKEETIPLISSEASPLRVNNFSSRNTLYMGVRVSYELVTQPQDQMVRGNVTYAAKLTNGNTVPLVTKSTEDSYFSLYRMKIFDFSINLPEKVSSKDVESIILTLHVDNGSNFQEAFPLTK